MTKLKGTELVEKRNVLNEIRRNNMGLQELRFFSIYLAKINARDPSTRVVRFPVKDFERIMEIKQSKIQHLKQITDSLLCKIVHIPNERGGYTSFQLFKKCTVDQNENDGTWYVEIDAHDEALPLMFEFKSHYFTYELWNALRLKSANQIRMYEILKQYEKIGRRELTVTELRELLGIEPNEYPRWDRFKERVLDACQKALAETTDITFSYERGRAGRGGKWLTIVFYIKKNRNYVDQLTLDEFIELQPKYDNIIIENTSTELERAKEFVTDVLEDEEDDYTDTFKEGLNLLNEACDNSFSDIELMGIFEAICRIRFNSENDIWIERFHYLRGLYIKLRREEINKKGTRNEIKDRYKYFLAIIQNEKE